MQFAQIPGVLFVTSVYSNIGRHMLLYTYRKGDNKNPNRVGHSAHFGTLCHTCAICAHIARFGSVLPSVIGVRKR